MEIKADLLKEGLQKFNINLPEDQLLTLKKIVDGVETVEGSLTRELQINLEDTNQLFHLYLQEVDGFIRLTNAVELPTVAR